MKAGGLTAQWAKRLGIPEGTAVAVGAFDAHMGAVGTEITEKTFVKILGTSCCDMAVAPASVIGDKLVAGICGQVDGSIIPGMIGLEAGQSAYGDVYAWFKNVLMWPLEAMLPRIEGRRQEDREKHPRGDRGARSSSASPRRRPKLESDETVPHSARLAERETDPLCRPEAEGGAPGPEPGDDARPASSRPSSNRPPTGRRRSSTVSARRGSTSTRSWPRGHPEEIPLRDAGA